MADEGVPCSSEKVVQPPKEFEREGMAKKEKYGDEVKDQLKMVERQCSEQIKRARVIRTEKEALAKKEFNRVRDAAIAVRKDRTKKILEERKANKRRAAVNGGSKEKAKEGSQGKEGQAGSKAAQGTDANVDSTADRQRAI